MTINLTSTVTQQYRDLWKTCEIRPKHAREVDQLVDRIVANKKRYKKAGNARGVPWHLVGVIHMLEGSGKFHTHLHKGDPLTARTANIPAGRPKTGMPPVHVGGKRRRCARARRPEPLDELVGAGNALRARAVQRLRLPEIRHRHSQPLPLELLEPPHAGRFIKDRVFSPTTVSRQCGAAVLLKRMVERNLTKIQPAPTPALPALR